MKFVHSLMIGSIVLCFKIVTTSSGTPLGVKNLTALFTWLFRNLWAIVFTIRLLKIPLPGLNEKPLLLYPKSLKCNEATLDIVPPKECPEKKISKFSLGKNFNFSATYSIRSLKYEYQQFLLMFSVLLAMIGQVVMASFILVVPRNMKKTLLLFFVEKTYRSSFDIFL